MSDTAPLARVLLEEGGRWGGRVVVWVCNRFDWLYMDQGHARTNTHTRARAQTHTHNTQHTHKS